MIRLLIGDDHPIVREGLKRLVAKSSDIEVVGEAASGDELLALASGTAADVVLLDVSMPGPGVLQMIQLLNATSPTLRVLVLSVHPEEQYAIRTLHAGAFGYLNKDHSPEELAGAIRRVAGGGRYVSPALAEELALRMQRGTEQAPHETLSDREHQVLCHLGAGEPIKEIAAQLSLSPKTVSTYRARLLEKLGLSSTADLIRYAIRHGLDV